MMPTSAAHTGSNSSNVPRARHATQSCKQVYAPIACLPYERNLVYCFILSVWDNIIGPQTIHVWKRKANPHRTSSATCAGSVEVEPPGEHSMSNLVIPSEPAAKPVNKPTHPPDTLSKVTPQLSCEAKQLPKRQMSTSRLQSIVQYVTEHTVTLSQVHQQLQQQQKRIQQDKEQQLRPIIMVLPHHGIVVQAVRFVVEEEGGVWVPHCFSLVVALQEEQHLLQVSGLTAAYLITSVRRLSALLGMSCLPRIGGLMQEPLQEFCGVLVALRGAALALYPLLPSAQAPPDTQQALTLLTAHLSSSGYTVVVGETSTAVNKVLMWLALFLPPADLHISRLCLDPHHNALQPGLLLQGLVSAGRQGIVSADRLLQFGRPVTLCDLNARTVMRSIPTVAGSTVHSNREVLRPATEVSGLVRKCLQDLQLLAGHSCDVRRGYIAAFLRSLRYQALAVIMWLKHSKSEDGKPKLPSALKEMFGLDEPSLAIVLAQADALQPGVSNLVRAAA